MVEESGSWVPRTNRGAFGIWRLLGQEVSFLGVVAIGRLPMSQWRNPHAMNTEKVLIGLSGLWKTKREGLEIEERSRVIVQKELKERVWNGHRKDILYTCMYFSKKKWKK